MSPCGIVPMGEHSINLLLKTLTTVPWVVFCSRIFFQCNFDADPALVPRKNGETIQIMDLIAHNYARTNSAAHGNGTNTTPAASAALPRRSPRDHQRGGRRNRLGASRSNRNDSGVAGQASARNRDPKVVKIMYWNIYHNFTLKLTDSEFHEVERI
jgi:hypothetical protein